MPLSNVGLVDFRAFSGATYFTFAPITIITGTNSSGKSSLLDAIRIMQKYFARSLSGILNNHSSWVGASELLLDDLIVRIPSASELINRSSADEQSFKIRFAVRLQNIDDAFYLYLLFSPEKGEQKASVQISLQSIATNKTVFNLSRIDAEEVMDVDFPFFMGAFEQEVTKQIAFYIALEKCYRPVASSDFISLKDDSPVEKVETMELDGVLFGKLQSIHSGMYEYYNQKIPWFRDEASAKWPEMKSSRHFLPLIEFLKRDKFFGFDHELDLDHKNNLDFDKLEVLKRLANPKLPYYNYILSEYPKAESDKNKLEYLTTITAEGMADLSQDEIMARLEKNWLQNLVFARSAEESPLSRNLLNDFFYILRDPVNHLRSDRQFNDTKIKFDFRLSEEDDAHKYQTFHKLLRLLDTGSNSWFRDDKDDKRGAFTEKGKAFFGTFLYPQFERLYTLLSAALQHEYVPSIRTFPQRFFGSAKSTFIDEVIAKFLEANPLENGAPEVRSFVQKYLKTFGIGDDVAIAYNDELGIKTIIISREGAKINLLDLGFGILQFVPLLLQIAITAARHVWRHDDAEPYLAITDSVMMLIEEPETNLHPALQSKLADMFVEASREFKIQFVIESHSEYLIRKLQYLTAKGEIEPDKTQIYYCNNPKDLSNGEPQVKKINIHDDGSLTDDFGTGFFDESDRIAIDLYNLTKSRHN